MNNLQFLKNVTENLELFHFESNDGELWGLMNALNSMGLSAKALRGDNMGDVTGVFNEFSAALQFPFIYSPTWRSLDECLDDMDQFRFGKGFVIVIHNSDKLFLNDDKGFSYLISSLKDAASAFAQPVSQGAWWDRPTVPFHVIFHTHAGLRKKLTNRLNLLQVSLDKLPYDIPPLNFSV